MNLYLLLPELILVGTACVLILFGMAQKRLARTLVPVLAVLALVVAFVFSLLDLQGATAYDTLGAVRLFSFGMYIKSLVAVVGILLVLLAWPSNASATGNSGVDYGTECGEFFALMLSSLAGVMLTASANDMITLFLAIELASIPAYIMVSISRPVVAAQEAGVKYFFLGAMAAALLLLGFSYLYGTTGSLSLYDIGVRLKQTVIAPGSPTSLTAWQMLAVVIIIAGLAFKMAAVPLHFYAADVYQGAGTPVTAFLSFVPKITGFVALVKILYCVGGLGWDVPITLHTLMWVMAALTMTIGNLLGLMQYNVKRVMAYSSIAHSGYMLVGITAQLGSSETTALSGVMFYLAAYGLMNAGLFGSLMLLPSRERGCTSAESFEDLAGQGRKHVAIGLAMSVCCFSLTGLPLTVGFFGKAMLLLPAYKAGLNWLVILMVINSAISAGYYLKIIATLFLRSEPTSMGDGTPMPAEVPMPRPVSLISAIAISVLITLTLGTIFPLTQSLLDKTQDSAKLEGAVIASPDMPAETVMGIVPVSPDALSAAVTR